MKKVIGALAAAATVTVFSVGATAGTLDDIRAKGFLQAGNFHLDFGTDGIGLAIALNYDF